MINANSKIALAGLLVSTQLHAAAAQPANLVQDQPSLDVSVASSDAPTRVYLDDRHGNAVNFEGVGTPGQYRARVPRPPPATALSFYTLVAEFVGSQGVIRQQLYLKLAAERGHPLPSLSIMNHRRVANRDTLDDLERRTSGSDVQSLFERFFVSRDFYRGVMPANRCQAQARRAATIWLRAATTLMGRIAILDADEEAQRAVADCVIAARTTGGFDVGEGPGRQEMETALSSAYAAEWSTFSMVRELHDARQFGRALNLNREFDRRFQSIDPILRPVLARAQGVNGSLIQSNDRYLVQMAPPNLRRIAMPRE